MQAESPFQPISREAIRKAKARLALDGDTVESWSRREGFNAKTVYGVLSGKRRAIRGQALMISIKLGLRPHPDDLPPASVNGTVNRAAKLSLGEPVR